MFKDFENFDFKISDDLYIVRDKDSPEYGKIYFCGDSFYGYYTISEFDEFLCQLVSHFLKIRSEIMKNSGVIDGPSR